MNPNKLFKLLSDLETIDRQLIVNTENHHNNPKLYLLAFSFLKICQRLIFTLYFSIVFHFRIFPELPAVWSTIGIDLAMFNYSFGFYSIIGILKKIVTILRANTYNSVNFLSLQKSYKLVVEISDRLKIGSDLMVSRKLK